MVRVVHRLLEPENGCPWDLKQTPDTVRLYILEEIYEMVEAVENGVTENVCEEMGDSLFMICFLARLYEKAGDFDLADALTAAADKMVARHPHIFQAGKTLDDADQVVRQWHEIKKKEKPSGLLDSVPVNLPALLRSHRLTERAGKAGFDWDGPAPVMDAVDAEMAELKNAIETGDKSRIAEELGDVFFTLVNLSRHHKINAEDCLRGANSKFTNRFKYIESELARKGQTPDDVDLAEMDRLWDEAKARGL